MGRKKRIIVDECRICGSVGDLSFEHVPNREAYNKSTTIEYSWGDVFVKKDQVTGKIVQGGIGEYTLCEPCNNNTGHWYGGEYTRWAKACFEFLQTRTPSITEPDETIIILRDVYPLRFLKQVIVCFFSITPGLSKTYPQLAKFILDKDQTQLPEDCTFFMNFYFGTKPKLRRWPIAGKLTILHKDGKLVPLSNSIISEITHPPFALIMSDKSGFVGAGNITHFADYTYDQHENITLKLRVIKGVSTLPGNFE